MTEEQLKSIFTLAGIPILNHWELPNHYWPSPRVKEDADQYHKDQFIEYQMLRLNSPWWLVKTPIGLIMIGWRKRVININWKDTGIEVDMPTEATKSPWMVHTSDDTGAIKYLKILWANRSATTGV